MSGICGAWVFDGSDSALEPLLALLERRGPDGTHSWADGSVALGHTSLATTPEALAEVLPLTEPDSGCTITADARLDNREELIGALDLAGETGTIGDGELILRAYLKWGESCPTHLLGDFAFAIWDPPEQRLFCARDHMGMRQLIYHHAPGKLFAFATEAEALIAHPGVPRRINEGRIADFLDDLEGIDFTSTFFEDVFRLPPAYRLKVDANGLSLCRYWVLTPGPELKLASDQDHAEAFLAVFTEAVRCRLRSAGPVGSMLSGGVDSNAVAAVAATLLSDTGQKPLATYSAIASDVQNCPETRAIEAGIEHLNCAPVVIDRSKLDEAIPDLIEGLRTNAEPFDGHMSLIRSIYRQAHRDGHKVVLDGVGADVVLTAGNAVARSLRKGHVARAWQIAKGRRSFWGGEEQAWTMMVRSAWSVFAPAPIHRFRRWAMAARQDVALTRGKQLIAPQFARSMKLKLRRNRYSRLSGTGASLTASDRAQTIAEPWFTAGRERYDRVASALAIEPRDPFVDVRLIEFCLKLPADQLEADGWPKIVLRRAMAGLVADDVRWRRGKEHLGGDFTTRIFDRWSIGGAPPVGESEAMARYTTLQVPKLFSFATMDSQENLKLVMLSLWFDRFDSGVRCFKE